MKRRIQSFKCAIRGIAEFVHLGANAKIQVIAALAVVIAGATFGFSIIEWIVIVVCIGSVLSAEAFNTAIEELADEVSEERCDRIRKVKDIAAGAVLISATASFVVFTLLVFKRT